MPTTLWIAEKKSLAEAVARTLGAPQFGWEQRGLTHNRVGGHWFVWLDGHAFEQAMPDEYLPEDVPRTASGRKVWRQADLPIVPQRWVLVPKEGKQARLARLVELAQAADVIHHLGDPDEEGQLIVDEALAFHDIRKPVRRVLVNDYNETKVREAVKGVRDNAEPLFRGWHRWSLARSRYDWLLGLNCTRAMTLRGRELGFDGLLPVGSVQTPLLYIVRERDRAIEHFTPVPYHVLVARIEHANGPFDATWRPGDDQPGLNEAGRLVDAAVASALAARLAGQPATIAAYAQARKTRKPPLPLSMNELQIEGFRRHGYSGRQVLDAAQVLYETHKVATYPRSDNRYLSEAQHSEAPGVIDAVLRLRPELAPLAPALDATRKSEAFDDRRMAGTPHHGIVPAVPESRVDPAAWTQVERDVHELIVRAYLAQFAAPFEYLQTDVEARVDGERFTATGRATVEPGWKAVFADAPPEARPADVDAAPEPAEGDQVPPLPAMAQGDDARCADCSAKTRKTTPPPRFDDALLTEAMMNVHKYVADEKARKRLKDGDGIGTTATRAGIVQDLKDRGLIVPLKPGSKKLMTSETARTLVDALPMAVKDPAQAGVFKARLDEVAQGALDFDAFLDETAAWVREVVQAARSLPMALPLAEGVFPCPKCGARLRRKEGERGAFWYCANWNREPDKCDARFQDLAGKPMLTELACPTCNEGRLRRKTPEGRPAFWFCSRWNAEPARCHATFEDKAGQPDLAPRPRCPRCATGELRRRAAAGKPAFWSCSNWNAEPRCAATFEDRRGKPDLAARPDIACPACGEGRLRLVRTAKEPFWGCDRYKAGCKASYRDKGGKPELAAQGKVK